MHSTTRSTTSARCLTGCSSTPSSGRMDNDEAIFKRILGEPELQATLMDLHASRVYRRAREEAS